MSDAQNAEPVVLAEATANEGKEVFIKIDTSEADKAMVDMVRRMTRINAARRRRLRRDPFARFARWLGRRLVAWGTRP